ncbi:MAG: NAD(P)-dependent oxidoreductase [Elusimicrobia bacterium]|nr:NAD(P)-dependent oxidoreductase [Elusimicrobiota bacterium]
MRILLTGATGFVGGHISRRLLAGGHELLALTRTPPRTAARERTSLSWLAGDLRDVGRVKGRLAAFAPEACVHAGWEGIPDFSEELSRANLSCSIDLLDALFNETPCRRLLVTGSCAEYGRASGPCVESSPCESTSFFAWAKRALFDYASMLGRRRSAEVLWFRIFYAYGPGQRRGALIPSLVDAFQRGRPPEVANPLNANDFIHVEDVAEAFASAIDRTPEAGIYNLGSGRATSVLDVCRIAEELVTGSTRVCDALSPGAGQAEPCRFWADTHKTRAELGWTPSIDLRSGIGRLLAPAPSLPSP